MATDDSKLLQRGLAPLFKPLGYLKDGTTWRRSSAEAVVVFNIQGSRWGRQFYLNLGAYFRALGDADRPKEHDCHVRNRLTNLLTDDTRLGQLLDFDEPIEASARVHEVSAIVTEVALPWLEAMATSSTAAAYLRKSTHPGLVDRDARALLQLSSGA